MCPNCGSALHLEHDGALDAWACPQHHGLGFTLSEAYSRMDEAEIHTIWQQARAGDAGTRACPICSARMVSVSVAPTTEAATTIALDVCLADEFIWFDAGELDEIPVDTNAPVPDPEEDAQIAEITERVRADRSARSGRARDSETMRDHLIHRLGPPSTDG